MKKQFVKRESKSEITARIFASLMELSILVMIALVLTALINYLYLDLTAGQRERFSSLAGGLTASLMTASVACIVPILGFFAVAEMFDGSKSTDGYVFEFLFDLYDQAQSRRRSQLNESKKSEVSI